MIVVADTTPLNYLVLIEEVHLLPALFSQVLLPQAAFQELQAPKTPPRVRQWLLKSPAWLEVRTVPAITNPALRTLDPGEREALQLALNLGISPVLIDETDARQVAKALLLKARGTLDIPERGAQLVRLIPRGPSQAGADQLPHLERGSGGVLEAQSMMNTELVLPSSPPLPFASRAVHHGCRPRDDRARRRGSGAAVPRVLYGQHPQPEYPGGVRHRGRAALRMMRPVQLAAGAVGTNAPYLGEP